MTLNSTKADPRPGPLFNAVRGGSERHTKCVRALLAHGADVNVKRGGKTALHYAIEHRYFKVYGNFMYCLLDGGADPNIKDANGDSPLLQILYGGYEPLEKHRRDALALLLQFNANVNIIPPGTQNMPLHLAVRRKDPWAVEMLLEKGADVNKPNGAGATPLALAVGSGGVNMTDNQKEVAASLLSRGAHVNEQIGASQNTALHGAIMQGQKDMVDLLLQYSANPEIKNNQNETAFDTASLSISSRKISPGVHAKIMHMLFEAIGIDIPSEETVCAIRTAAYNSDVLGAESLLGHGANANHGPLDHPLLHYPIANGDLAMVKLLVENGAVIDHKSKDGYNALEWAVQCEQKEIGDYLRDASKRAEGRK